MCDKKVTTKRTKTKERALASLQALAARSEKSSGDCYRLMRSWGVAEGEWEWVMSRLYADKFIDDERYARAYIREKISINGWGAYKIVMGLRGKGVAKEIIDEAIDEIEKSQFTERLYELLGRKARSVKYENIYQLKDKLLRFGAARGYDFDTMQEAIERVVNEIRQ